MSYNINMGTITIDDTTYDVETHGTDLGQRMTISLDGEDVFDGLEGRCENEEYIEEFHNPRDWSNVGTMSVSYNRYNLGDEDISQINFDVTCTECEGCGMTGAVEDEITCDKCEGTGEISLHPVEYFKRERGARVVLPLSVYEHSGITMFVGHEDYTFDPGGWDTSYVGFIFDTPEGIKDCMGDDASDEQIKEALIGEVKVYASYLEGDVSYYSVTDDETDYHESCGGYVGDHKQCEDECYSALESAIVKRLAEVKERAEWAARDTITI